MKEGIVIINKPEGITSHDVVSRIRQKFKIRRVGHAGTLDPMATGILIILLGRATKLFNRFVNLDKAYRATLILGTATSSADIQGTVISEKPFAHISATQIERAFGQFQGEIEQVPPMVSAIKIKGKKLYELARKGIEVERKPRRVMINCLRVEDIRPPHVQFYVACSKGTYVRQLAEDIGKVLGCGACISRIERVQVGPYTLSESVNIEDLNEDHIRPWPT